MHIDRLNTKSLKNYIIKTKKVFWDINKDKISVCQDCQFRYMCIDKRIPIQRSNKSWYYKTECNYNPFIGKWKGDEGYLTLEECGVITSEEELFIDHEKIARINNAFLND